ncbi:hypothetical protein I6B53_08490 [Schaalia sp. 19OD2882]|uniref:flavodoxin domain-containing protein n=1 Tax=Schaalia sp. 19OD2882 TaxID=2794089 RepID=UPI001C1ECC2D|nr:flavodoxin domain-containing protein [Schaalia sp. 19OD2882]QWW19140.1 hypothetical protein I6B53_08490 [Schaalia sp. 19OD2882]
MHVLSLHSSRFGHTTRIVARMADILHGQGHRVTLRPAEVMRSIGDDVDAVLIGASVRYGYYSPKLRTFTRRHAQRLNAVPTAFVGVSLSSENPARSEPMTNTYSRKFLQATPWEPTRAILLGGEIDFDLYRGLDAFVMDKILAHTGKPHGPGAKVDYTDWDKVEAFAREFAQLLTPEGEGRA